MASLLQKLSLRRPVDKHGPRTLLVVNIGPDSAKCVLLSRTGRKVSIEGFAHVSVNLEHENIIKQICKKTGLKSKYCSVILKERDEQVRLLRVSSRSAEPDEIKRFVTESFGADKQYTSSYQFVGQGKDDSEKLLLAGLLKKEQSNRWHKEVEAAGAKPVSLGLESISLINLSLDLSVDDHLRAFLHIGEVGSILTVTQGKQLKFVHTFPHGNQCILESIMNGMELEQREARAVLEQRTENFDAYMDMEVVSWMHQIALSLDFAERDFGHAVESVTVYGDGAESEDVREMLAQQVYREINQPDMEELLKHKLSTSNIPENVNPFILPIIEGAEIMLGDLNNED